MTFNANNENSLEDLYLSAVPSKSGVDVVLTYPNGSIRLSPTQAKRLSLQLLHASDDAWRRRGELWKTIKLLAEIDAVSAKTLVDAWAAAGLELPAEPKSSE